MLRSICAALDLEDPEAPWVLEHAADLARRWPARLTVVSVARAVDEPLGAGEDLLDELLGRREDVRRRRELTALAARAAADLAPEVRVLSGRIAPQLLAFLERERPDLLVAGAGRRAGLARRIAHGPIVPHALVAHAPCPVLLVPRRVRGAGAARLSCPAPASRPRPEWFLPTCP